MRDSTSARDLGYPDVYLFLEVTRMYIFFWKSPGCISFNRGGVRILTNAKHLLIVMGACSTRAREFRLETNLGSSHKIKIMLCQINNIIDIDGTLYSCTHTWEKIMGMIDAGIIPRNEMGYYGSLLDCLGAGNHMETNDTLVFDPVFGELITMTDFFHDYGVKVVVRVLPTITGVYAGQLTDADIDAAMRQPLLTIEEQDEIFEECIEDDPIFDDITDPSYGYPAEDDVSVLTDPTTYI